MMYEAQNPAVQDAQCKRAHISKMHFNNNHNELLTFVVHPLQTQSQVSPPAGHRKWVLNSADEAVTVINAENKTVPGKTPILLVNG